MSPLIRQPSLVRAITPSRGEALSKDSCVKLEKAFWISGLRVHEGVSVSSNLSFFVTNLCHRREIERSIRSKCISSSGIRLNALE